MRRRVLQTIRCACAAPAPVQIVNIGGGFGILYFLGNCARSDTDQGDSRRSRRVRRQVAGREARGRARRYIVGEAGIYVCRVIDRKISRGDVFLVTDGGMHRHLSVSATRPGDPEEIPGCHRRQGSRRGARDRICCGTALRAIGLPCGSDGPRRGARRRLVVVFQSGACGLTASPMRFLSHRPRWRFWFRCEASSAKGLSLFTAIAAVRCCKYSAWDTGRAASVRGLWRSDQGLPRVKRLGAPLLGVALDTAQAHQARNVSAANQGRRWLL